MTVAAAAVALRKSVYARLTTDAGVVGALGGPRVYDEVPRASVPPYLVIGEGSLRDWSTSAGPPSTGVGHEHGLTLTVWSAQGGATEAFRIADAIVASLESMPPQLDGHRLANLVAIATEVKRERDGRLLRGTIRLRAVTEPVT